jgi:hypothetical protein|tara:strand:- start:134 stop:421 length:288 start_codon:yes stop_codon:yes gene_type:complete
MIALIPTKFGTRLSMALINSWRETWASLFVSTTLKKQSKTLCVLGQEVPTGNLAARSRREGLDIWTDGKGGGGCGGALGSLASGFIQRVSRVTRW